MMKSSSSDNTIRYVDLFCGIGGFRIALEQAANELNLVSKCVFSCDIDDAAARAYSANFTETPAGDIKQVNEANILEHDLLLAGFPCQAFSIIGNGKGFEEKTQGTLFFDIARILKEKKPKAFVLENVKRLVSHDKSRTMDIILKSLENLGYSVDYKVLNALNFGLPQKRERVFIVGFLGPWPDYKWPKGTAKMKGLSDILEPDDLVPEKFWASDYIKNKRKAAHTSKHQPSIWHENKAGNICSYPYSCALRANASHNYLLVNGERRLTPREMLRLQGFPDKYKIVCTDSQTRTQAGNSLPVPVAYELIKEVLAKLQRYGRLGGDSTFVRRKEQKITKTKEC
jgi:DNA (cytosine-5)-methyltransferase 1